MAYKVESEFIHNDLTCVVIMTDMGHRCGYVGIPEEHFLYGKNYNDNCLPFIDVEDNPIDKRGILPLLFRKPVNGRISPDLYFNVHGGITYADGGKKSTYPIKSDLWWFGFDCAHAGDGDDLEAVYKYELFDEEEYNYKMMMNKRYPIYGEIRSLEYCINECRNLAEQIAETTKE